MLFSAHFGGSLVIVLPVFALLSGMTGRQLADRTAFLHTPLSLEALRDKVAELTGEAVSR